MKKLPLGIQNFRKIIEGDYVYVDKTRYVYDIINNASYYFLSRPRRFGKSLLLDTISEAFSGNKQLFNGLYIYDTDYAFAKHPVLRLDMSRISNKTPDILESSLLIALTEHANKESLKVVGSVPSDIFQYLIEALHNKYQQRVVVLIDEYDKPILDHFTNLETAEANRQVLRGFYGILKSMDPYLRLTFITGVSKFTKTSIFSELNNLLDITLMEEYANICGIDITDLSKYFDAHIQNLASLKKFKRYSNLQDEILAWYDGYSWDGLSRVINPFSLLSFFMQKRFASFWYASGTPKFLIDIIKKAPEVYINLKGLLMTEYMLDYADLEALEAEPLLFQTGYLTVKEILDQPGAAEYRLDIPNYEVSEAFNYNIIAALSGKSNAQVKQSQTRIGDALRAGEPQQLREILKSLFASIPYELHINREAYYHSIFYAVMSVLGFGIEAEVSTAKGRVDAVLELADKVYVMEFKYVDCEPDASDEVKSKLFETALREGFEQIKERGYCNKFLGCGKTIYQVAFAFLGRDDIEMKVEITINA
ncbi:MAG: ATP-binding protein [Clostridiales bacterium]|nr:ATP-binding protein [Clostridiales bacterium]